LNQELHFCIEITLKLIYKHLEVKKFSAGFAPGPPGRGRKGKGGEWRRNRRGEGRGGREEQEGEKGEGREGKESGRNAAPSKNSFKKSL
jgi:hypothetical protein